jgi:aminoglycoside phosphotransferase (APT) family kinase protein
MSQSTEIYLHEDGLVEGTTLEQAGERLRAYVSSKLGTQVEVLRFERLEGGASNFTYAFDVRVPGTRDERLELIIRWDPEFGLVEPYDMARQFRVMHALQGSAVPLPKTYWLEEDLSVLGRAFYVVGKVDAVIGDRVIGGRDPSRVKPRRESHVRTLATIHSTDWKAVGLDRVLELPGEGTTYARREIDRWETVINRKLAGPDPVLESAARWMRNNAIETGEVCLLHGDCSGTNYMYKGDDVAAVIDWEMSTLGDPMVEIGWYCGAIESMGPTICGLSVEEIAAARRDFLAGYRELTGRALDDRKIRFGQVFFNYQLCSVLVSGDWIRRQKGLLPDTEEHEQYGRIYWTEIERLTTE